MAYFFKKMVSLTPTPPKHKMQEELTQEGQILLLFFVGGSLAPFF